MVSSDIRRSALCLIWYVEESEVDGTRSWTRGTCLGEFATRFVPSSSVRPQLAALICLIRFDTTVNECSHLMNLVASSHSPRRTRDDQSYLFPFPQTIVMAACGLHKMAVAFALMSSGYTWLKTKKLLHGSPHGSCTEVLSSCSCSLPISTPMTTTPSPSSTEYTSC